MRLVWLALLLGAAHAIAHAEEARSEGLTAASSAGLTAAKAVTAQPNGPPMGPLGPNCCRICPNSFYAIPRVVPHAAAPRFAERPSSSGTTPAPWKHARGHAHGRGHGGRAHPSARSQREARFRAVFDRAEPNEHNAGDFSFVAFAEQLSVRSGSASDSEKSRFEPENLPEWPKGVYTNDPYQNEPIPYFTKEAEHPGTNCCNVCRVPGARRKLKYPELLRWGENPATDDFPDSPYSIPCCKLCSSGCFSNGSRHPPGAAAVLAPRFASLESEAEETEHARRNADTDSDDVAFAEISAAVEAKRRKHKFKSRGNWPKSLDPPGANRPHIEPPRDCSKDAGCCSVCYNDPMIYDHAPSGVW